MTRYACDHSTAGAHIGAELTRRGFDGIVRYACEGRADVNITPAEIRDLEANGIPIAVVLEHEAEWLLFPPAVPGRVHASVAITRACGLPDGVIYMAADFDATLGGPTSPGSPGDQKMHTILRSLLFASIVIGEPNVGFYGSAYAIDWLVEHAPWLKWYWCTEAWSHGRVHHRAQLYQRAESQKVGGVDVDVDIILEPDFGQRLLFTPAERLPRANPQPTSTKPKRKRPKIHLPKVHPKVTAAAAGGAIAAAIAGILHTAGVNYHLTPAEIALVTTATATLAGYLKASGA